MPVPTTATFTPAATLEANHPCVSAMLEEAEADILAYMGFPEAHWRQIRSTNLLERLNREIAHRADVVGIFPNRDAVLGLIGMVLAEQNDKWQIGRRYLGIESLAALKPLTPIISLPENAPLEAAAGLSGYPRRSERKRLLLHSLGLDHFAALRRAERVLRARQKYSIM